MLNRDALNRGNENSNVLIRVAIALIIGLLSLAAGLWIGNTVLDSSGNKASELQAEIQSLQSKLAEIDSAAQVLVEDVAAAIQMEENLRTQLSLAEEKASSALQTLAQKESELELLSSAQEQIAALEKQIGKEESTLENLREMSDAIESHRLLLVELRKELPETREESVTYWNTMKTIAARADPALASPADKVILKIDNYFDWNDRSPYPTAPPEDYLNWLTDRRFSGADAYLDATATFNRDAMLAVITEMDAVVSQLN